MKILVEFAAAIIVAVLMAYPTKWAVNCLFSPLFLVAVFGVTKFTWALAFCLNFLGSQLFKCSVSGKE